MRQRVAVARALAMNPEIPAARRAAVGARRADAREAAGRDRSDLARGAQDRRAGHQRRGRGAAAGRSHHSARRPGRAPRSGREFRVNLPRPRDRKAVNHDPQYRRLRAQITQYLLDVEARAAGAGRRRACKLPDVVPITSADFLPKAVRAANKPKPLANPDKYVEFYNVTKVYPTPQGPAHRGRRLSARHQARRVRLADRPLGLRQVHGAVDVRGPHRCHRRRHHARRPRGRRAPAPIAASCSRRRTCCPGSRRGRTSRSASIASIRTPRSAERRDIVDYYLTRVGLGDVARQARAATCRTACASAWAWRARSRCRPSCCCSTSRSACSTR